MLKGIKFIYDNKGFEITDETLLFQSTYDNEERVIEYEQECPSANLIILDGQKFCFKNAEELPKEYDVALDNKIKSRFSVDNLTQLSDTQFKLNLTPVIEEITYYYGVPQLLKGHYYGVNIYTKRVPVCCIKATEK